MGALVIGLMEWAASSRVDDRPWLILGKGPTFSRHVDFDLAAFNLLGLNHVVRELEIDVVHAIDLDVVADCSDAIRTNSRWLIMPRRPHIECAPSGKALEEFFAELPVLQELSDQGRLCVVRPRALVAPPVREARDRSSAPAG